MPIWARALSSKGSHEQGEAVRADTACLLSTGPAIERSSSTDCKERA